MEKFWGRKCSFSTYVYNVRLNSVNRESRDLRWRRGCLFTFVGTSHGHLCDSTAFLYAFVQDKVIHYTLQWLYTPVISQLIWCGTIRSCHINLHGDLYNREHLQYAPMRNSSFPLRRFTSHQ